MQDRVKSVGGVARVEVPPRGRAVAVKHNGLAAVEEADEFWDDFCGSMVSKGKCIGK